MLASFSPLFDVRYGNVFGLRYDTDSMEMYFYYYLFSRILYNMQLIIIFIVFFIFYILFFL